ncbi:MAG TPA: aspartate kinase [Burkholderiales bacterium]|nr:aspartate kinase [Burkholderiales bacterium]
MWVVKLGGSLAHSEDLPRWLEVIATAGAGKAVLVPGGGPWADEVRVAQKCENFDDRVAHRKALRAMEQYGRLLAAMHPGLVAADSIEGIRKVLRKTQVPVWMPYKMVVADPLIPENWNVTSDSLAAWLADKLNVTALLLVKSFAISQTQPPIEDMVRRGWVDPAFREFTSPGRFHVRVLGMSDQKIAGEILASCTLVGVPIRG